MKNYDDIINLPHPEPKKHQRMSMENRAAQFSPFAALTGHNDAIKETERLTDSKVELEEDEIADINRRLVWLRDNIKTCPKAVITYFVPDGHKTGGKYVTATAGIKKIDELNHCIVTEDNVTIPIHNVISLK